MSQILSKGLDRQKEVEREKGKEIYRRNDFFI